MTDHIQIENQFTSGVYGKREYCFVKGQGTTLWDNEGRKYLDFGTGISVANLGHCHPKLVTAIQQQAATLMTAPELGYNDQRAQLLSQLASVTPDGINRFFLCNSGTEAVEGCIKFAHCATGRSNFVATMRGFHGRTIGSLAATHNKKYREPFAALTPTFTHVPYNNVDKLASAVNDQTAAVIIELVQGEGGVRAAKQDFVTAARKICDDNGAKLIIDEVQTGFGRTGKMFACEHFDAKPDLLALGKAIAGGVPMGAIGIGDSVGQLKPGLHGSTFGGNPLACAAALANLEILHDEDLIANSATAGAYFIDRLRQIESSEIREVRGIGLMIGVEMKSRVAPILGKMMEAGFLVLNAGPTVVRFLPPLNVTTEQIDAVVECFSNCVQQIQDMQTA